ncbi:adenylyl-sulfate kinase [Pseudomonas syringae]|uniref:Adenylyl-sulfate kinase n=1 Tax=Pseudomonas syringae TaxID=317 RepID=A0A085VCS5_PSESX|nr:adenylyl-sulfate kinase [Pseudomonas syringae]KFE53238.1 adenylylsulfate kinase [Pseudomonas syringae]
MEGVIDDYQQPNDHSACASHRSAMAVHDQGTVLWFTGLSASGKSTIANALDFALRAQGLKTCMLDGDVLRNGLCRDLGFSAVDREENVRRVAEVAALMADAGLTVMVALISPTRTARHHARSIVGSERFAEIFVDVPLAVAEQRDPKGLYRKARSGALHNFTGIDAPYETPVFPEVHLRSDVLSIGESVEDICAWLDRSGCSLYDVF